MNSKRTRTYFAARINWDLTPNVLTQALQKRRRLGLPILDLTESNPTHCGFQYEIEEISQALASPQNFTYEPHPKGLLKAREAVANYYREQGLEINPEQVFLTASTSEAYSFLFRLLVNPQENVLVPQPSYPLFDFLADLNDVQLKTYALIYEKVPPPVTPRRDVGGLMKSDRLSKPVTGGGNGWRIDSRSLKQAIDESTKAILVVNPNNPTGSYVKKDELAALIQIAKERELTLISDEVFFDYAFKEPKQFQSLSNVSEVLTFTLNGLSKAAALPQMKLGWIIANGPKDLLAQAIERLEVIADTYLSVNTPIQQALPVILKNRNSIQNQIKSRLASNLEFLKKCSADFPACEVLEAEGGWYAILKIPKSRSDDDWALMLLEKEGVFLHPCHFYNFENEGHLIASLIIQPKIFQEGIKRILKRISQSTKLCNIAESF